MAGPTPSIPQDMRDLLIRLDQRVDDGFKNVNDKLDAINRRTDDIDGRVRKLEDWRTEFNGGTKGITLMGSFIKWAAPIVIGAASVLGVQAFSQPKQVAKVEIQQTTSGTIPDVKH